ncbi:hypothetical protein Q8A67_009395 [Cirrhinus molitorella]|uniref:C-type lectin domain-containing protein n=1 Tax=Cirrhinus molitorella TaxID=172907 RepID=A0AA88TRJ9_9TELE|nr:hypothetical protein Q8A67_009395 [Cirrhinus molitorella]
MWVLTAFVLFAVTVNGDRDEVGFGRPNRQRCPAGWEKFEMLCYKFFFFFFDDLKTWAEAEKQCVDLDGNLASVHSKATHNFLKTFVRERGRRIPRVWIGAHDATQIFPLAIGRSTTPTTEPIRLPQSSIKSSEVTQFGRALPMSIGSH